ncbi:MAG: hypothetical protein IT536_14275 [Hyphomicrobiales bacterium]|nr:hypothetical protein [Hyphomicrobiales bacterium]
MAILTLIAAALPAVGETASKGPNGGILIRVEDHPVEFVVREGELAFYISDHDGKPMPTAGMKARAIVQDGGKTVTVILTPAPPNLFVGKLAAPLGAKARVAFTGSIEGHMLTARFVAP